MGTRYMYGSVGLLLVLALVVVQGGRSDGSEEEPHSFAAGSNEIQEEMEMPGPTDGGALGDRLESLVIDPDAVPELEIVAPESGFYAPDVIVSLQENPEAAEERYKSEGLNGGYLRTFEGAESIRQLQASVLSFESESGAQDEFAYAQAHESQGDDLRAVDVPIEQSFAVAFTTEVNQESDLTGVLIVVLGGSDVSTVYVAGTTEEATVAFAISVASAMHEDQRGA